LRLTFRNIIFSPISLVYGMVTSFRNLLYDKELIQSTRFNFPVISVGNITVGGTGKTPHVEFLIELLQAKYKVAVLSRGYKRRTKGFLLASENSNSQAIGDEPFQIYQKFKNATVAVDEKRVNGIQQLKGIQPDINVVLLDDAFQHRAVNPGLKILLTDYSRLYIHDSLLPGGLLRECKSGSKRADIVVITKCPTGINDADITQLTHKLNIQSHQSLYFSTIVYNAIKPVFNTEKQSAITDLTDFIVLLVTGIVTHTPIVDHLKQQNALVETLSYRDHHHFTSNNYSEIEQKFIHLQSDKKIILVTEKDAARIVSSPNFPESLKNCIYFLPIRIQFLQNKQTQFSQNVINYVETYTRNS
jgi:tetraacyldisaccharide 4'-kinase